LGFVTPADELATLSFDRDLTPFGLEVCDEEDDASSCTFEYMFSPSIGTKESME